jgi:multicomponent K+:H+ antiporter subunit F
VSAATLLAWGLGLAQGMLVLAMALAAWRTLRGPRAQDRVLGLDTVYLNGMLAIMVHGLRTGSALAFEAALVVALLGFAATLALAKFLMQGEVIQ